MDEDNIIEKRKEQAIKFFKQRQIWVLVLLIGAVVLGVYIRTMPMQDHGGRPGLWDITTNTWTLGPDLDPWLFTRYAKTIVEKGSLPKVDMMRNVPRGFDTSGEMMLHSYIIVANYYIFNMIGDYNVEFAAVITPVMMFALTIIVFFLFAREIFLTEDKSSRIRANLIAIISIFLMVVIPVLLSRTIAGIPEKESSGFFFMFLSFYLFLKAVKSKDLKKAAIFGSLSGIASALMGFVWGGVIYVFITIALLAFIAFAFDKIGRKEFIAYTTWILFTFSILILFSSRYSINGIMTSTTQSIPFIVLFIFLVHLVLWNTRISQMRLLKESKIPQNLISLLVALVLLFLLVFVLFGPDFIVSKLKAVHQTIFKPVTGRWNITVAENRQPYLNEWQSNFGPFIRNFPIFFWLFFIGSIVLFKEMVNKLKQKEAWVLTGAYVLFLFGLVFSRISPSSLFNGENLISKSAYYGSALLFAGLFMYYYYQYYNKKESGFKELKIEYLFLFVFFLLCLFTARGAVRLIMVTATSTPIFVAYLIVSSVERFKNTKDETWKIVMGAAIILIILLSFFAFWSFYKSVKYQAYSFVPSHYNQQWQKAMKWVRDETPSDAVFGHWWDYGYWVQSIGERATVLDGGNAVSFWNYYMGRLVLTGDNQEDALEFLYNHKTTHYLIDSTDIGKYGAFSSIGSDQDFDRYSWIGILVLDEKQIQETNNQTLLVYPGGIALDENYIHNDSGEQVFFPKQQSGVGGVVIPTENSENGTTFGQPYIMLFYNNKQYKVNLRYLAVNGEFIDFGSGMEGCANVIPRLLPDGQGRISTHPLGAVMFLSPRLMRGMLTQIYILDDPLNNFPNFKLKHTESNIIIESLRGQGMNLPDFVHYQGLQGPIKIWEVEYTGDEKIKKEYLDTDPTKYLDWKL